MVATFFLVLSCSPRGNLAAGHSRHDLVYARRWWEAMEISYDTGAVSKSKGRSIGKWVQGVDEDDASLNDRCDFNLSLKIRTCT